MLSFRLSIGKLNKPKWTNHNFEAVHTNLEGLFVRNSPIYFISLLYCNLYLILLYTDDLKEKWDLKLKEDFKVKIRYSFKRWNFVMLKKKSLSEVFGRTK